MEYLKIILYGVISSIIFFFFIQYFGNGIGYTIFNGGDSYENSYHIFTRMAL